MDMIKTLQTLQEVVLKDLTPLTAKGTLTPAEVKVASDAVCLLKEIQQIMYMDAYEDEEGYSERYNWPMMSSNAQSRSSRTGRYMSSRDGRYGGYSGHSIEDRMIANLEGMMDSASNDYERQTIRSWINNLRK